MNPVPGSTAAFSDSEPESIRQAYLHQESGIKSVGQLCHLVAFFSVLGTLEFVLFALGVIPRNDLKLPLPPPLLDVFFWIVSALFAINTVAQIVLGYGLIRLQPWARWTVVVLTVLSLLMNTISSLALTVGGSGLELLEPLVGFSLNGTIVGLTGLIVGGALHLLILWPLVRPGSDFLFSADYRQVMRQTPEIKSRMHWLLKLTIGILITSVVGFIAVLIAILYGGFD